MPWPHDKYMKHLPFSEEPVCIVSKRDPCMIWAGSKTLYSGTVGSGDPHPPVTLIQASGYNYWSGESDVEPINLSGWGMIRIPEVNQLHKIFVFPRTPCIEAVSAYLTHYDERSGMGGCSGKIALLKYKDECQMVHPASGQHTQISGYHLSGIACCQFFGSGAFNSGIVDVIAFGSEY